ncbi:MAG: hypothetical protein U1E62_18920 [Alsobacter sp.]
MLDILHCRLDPRCPLQHGRTHSIALRSGRRIRFRVSHPSPGLLFALGPDWWAVFYRDEAGDMVLDRVSGNPMSCYDDIGQVSRLACSCYRTCWMSAVRAEPAVEAAGDRRGPSPRAVARSAAPRLEPGGTQPTD